MENQPKLNSNKKIITFLAERFPDCFSLQGEARPLKIGIFQDLVERLKDEMDLSKTQLRSALRQYTSSWRYLYGIKVGAVRVDLDGYTCGAIDEQHIEHARNQLQEAKARVKARRELHQAVAEDSTTSSETVSPSSCQTVPNKPTEKKVALREHSKPNHPVQNHVNMAARKEKSLQPATDISAMHIKQHVKVRAGKNAMDATILEISKDGVRVQLVTGLEMIVRPEHLQL